MNKLVKGSLAGSAGIVLLMGGFGTYAVWQNSTAADLGSVGSGSLSIDKVGTPTWTSSAGDWSPTDLMVPGDTVTETVPLDVTASGKDLKAELSLSGVTSTFSGLQITLSYAGKTSTTVTGSGTPTIDYAAADVSTLNGAKTATVTFTLPGTVTGDQDATVDLSKASLNLDQVLS